MRVPVNLWRWLVCALFGGVIGFLVGALTEPRAFVSPAPDAREARSSRAENKVAVTKSDDDESIVLTTQPVTVRFVPSEKLKSQITSALKSEQGTIRLSIRGLTPSADPVAPTGVNIFLNRPLATAKTSIEDTHFAEAVEFSLPEHPEAQDFNVDITRSLKRLSKQGLYTPGEPIQVTLVAASPTKSGFADRFSIPIERLELFAKTDATIRAATHEK